MDTTENNAFRATEDDWGALRKEIVERSQALDKTNYPTELDYQIAWMGLVIDVLQEHGWADDVADFDATLVKLIDTRLRIQASQGGPYLIPPGNRKTVKSNPTKET